MLQIIGFLGCVYLIVKAFELWGTRSTSRAHAAGATIAFIASPLFFLMFVFSGVPATDFGSSSTDLETPDGRSAKAAAEWPNANQESEECVPELAEQTGGSCE